jgi:hypothetical protein
MGGIELVLDESVDDGALADGLVSDEDYLELDGVFLVGGVADLVVVPAHTQIINYQTVIFYKSNGPLPDEV